MIESLLVKGVVPIPPDYSDGDPNMPPITDNSKRPIEPIQHTIIDGVNATDSYGNQFQINTNGTAIVAPQFNSNNTAIINIGPTGIIGSRTNVANTFGLALDDAFTKGWGYGPTGVSGLRWFTKAANGVWSAGPTVATDFDSREGETKGPDNYHSSSDGTLIYTGTNVCRTANGVVTKTLITDANMKGCIYSEDNKRIITFSLGDLVIRAYELNTATDTYELVDTLNTGTVGGFGFASGVDVGWNFDATLFVYPSLDNFYLYEYNKETRKLSAAQMFDDPDIGTQTLRSNSTCTMDRAGTLLAISDINSFHIHIYQKRIGGFVKVATILKSTYGIGLFPRGHKVKLSPNGDFIVDGNAGYNDRRGRMIVYRLFRR